MHPIQKAITGKESIGDFSSPQQALIQFYCAFNSGNMQMMSENWAQSDEIAMDNPLGVGCGKRGTWGKSAPNNRFHLTAFGAGMRRAICKVLCYHEFGVLPESAAGELCRWAASLGDAISL